MTDDGEASSPILSAGSPNRVSAASASAAPGAVSGPSPAIAHDLKERRAFQAVRRTAIDVSFAPTQSCTA
jgi:hypothetical protein